MESALSAHPQCAEAAICRWVKKGAGALDTRRHLSSHLKHAPPHPPARPPARPPKHTHPTPTPTQPPSVPHDVKGEAVYAFVVLMEGAAPGDATRRELVDLVRGRIGAFAVPDTIHWWVTFRVAGGGRFWGGGSLSVGRGGLRVCVLSAGAAMSTNRRKPTAPLPPRAPGLPKTRSGKVMRRILKQIALKRYGELGDISGLAEPHVRGWGGGGWRGLGCL